MSGLPEYYEHPYECGHCKRFAHALGDKECSIDWQEVLHGYLHCNRCADLLAERIMLVEKLSSIQRRLTSGVTLTTTGHRGLDRDERQDLERLRVILHGKLRAVNAELNERKHAPKTALNEVK